MNKPYVICHILTALDGRISGDWFHAPACAPALALYGALRTQLQCEATLYGTTTMRESYAHGLMDVLPHSETVYPYEDFVAQPGFGNYIVSMDAKGTFAWNDGFIEKSNRPRAHVIQVLTRQVSADYLSYLREKGVSYLFAGDSKIECAVVLEKLNSVFGIQRLILAGGGLTDFAFASKGLVDELSIVMAPVANGDSSAPALFDSGASAPGTMEFQLIDAQIHDGGALWLRYRTK